MVALLTATVVYVAWRGTWPRRRAPLKNGRTSSPNPILQFASSHLRKMVLNISLPDNYGYVVLTAMSTGWLLVVRRLPIFSLEARC